MAASGVIHAHNSESRRRRDDPTHQIPLVLGGGRPAERKLNPPQVQRDGLKPSRGATGSSDPLGFRFAGAYGGADRPARATSQLGPGSRKILVGKQKGASLPIAGAVSSQCVVRRDDRNTT